MVAFTRAADNNLVQPGASAWGTDWIGETKVPLPLGAASAKDQCERIGHLVAFGNTEEWLHRQILGCRARDLPPPGAAPASCRLPPLTTRQARATSPSTGATTTTRVSISATKWCL